jgi:CheY-like chemotaxis protein
MISWGYRIMSTLALVSVQDIVDWLRQTEERIGQLYGAAAKVCSHDASLSTFLGQLAEDERLHTEFMSGMWENLQGAKKEPVLRIVLDHETRRQVEGLFERFQRVLVKASIPRRDVMEYVARIESSELNPVFLYVADEYRKASPEGERMTGEIQGHLLRIQSFIEALPKNQRPSIDVCTLPSVGELRFLVVDDYGPVRRLMASLLSRRGLVDTADDGQEGLERLRGHFHNGVVTDIQMPGMDGLDFYKRAVEYDGTLKRRFLFCSGDVDSKATDYLRRNNLPLLKKPFGLQDFRGAVEKLLSLQ